MQVHVPPGQKNGADFALFADVDDFLTTLLPDQRAVLVILTSDATFLPLLQTTQRDPRVSGRIQAYYLFCRTRGGG